MRPKYGDYFIVKLIHDEIAHLEEDVLYGRAFNEMHDLILYVNSLHRITLTLNQDSVVKKYGTGLGNGWTICITPLR